MLSNKTNKKYNNRNKKNIKHTKKRKNVKTKKQRKLIGGAGRPIIEHYTYIETLGKTGSKGASNLKFDIPNGVAVSAVDNCIYVSDNGNKRVQVFDGATRNYIATLRMKNNYPNSIAVSADGKLIYVTNSRKHCVLVFEISIKNKTLFSKQKKIYNQIDTLGTPDVRGKTQTQFDLPLGVAVSAKDNRIYVADFYNHRVQVFDGETRNYIATLGTTGSWGDSNTQFHNLGGVAVSAKDNRIYVVDCSNSRVQVFDGETRDYIATLGTSGSSGASNTQFNYPYGVAVSAADNRIYVADSYNRRVQVFDGATRNYIATLGTTRSSGPSNSQFRLPMGVAVSADGKLIYVADTDNHRVQVFKNNLPAYNNSPPQYNSPPPYISNRSPPYVNLLSDNASAIQSIDLLRYNDSASAIQSNV